MAVLNVEPDAGALALAAAQRVAALLESTLGRHPDARLCLTGGRTPRDLYRLLGDPSGPFASRIDWTRVHLFWGDERHVPPDHQDSNYGLARPLLVASTGIPVDHVHRMRGELPDAKEAAREYDDLLRAYLRPAGALFDIMLLGLGEDAHIASLFPGNPLLAPPEAAGTGSPSGQEACERVVAAWAPHLGTWRITLTPAAILDADRILIITAGAPKASAVQAALQAPDAVSRWPAQVLRRAGDRVEWWLDRAAASAL